MENTPLISLDAWTWIFTIVNLIILYLVLKKFLYKPVKKMMESRAQEVEGMYSKANEDMEKAESLKAEYHEKMSSAKNEAQEILSLASQKANSRSDEIIEEAKNKAHDIIVKSEQQIKDEKKKAVNQIKDEISDIALIAASKVIEKDLTSKDNEKLIEDFINDVGELKWQD